MSQPVSGRVLVVDDDVVMREQSARIFGDAAWSVRTAGCGAGALEHINSEEPYDILIVDLNLPDVLGTELIARVPVGRRAPFLLISGFLDVPTTVAAMRLGAANVLEKPVDIFDLLRWSSEIVARTRRPPPAEPPVLGVSSPGAALGRV